jgi:uncharacterized protein YkwD
MKRIVMSTVLALILIAEVLFYFFARPGIPAAKIVRAENNPHQPSSAPSPEPPPVAEPVQPSPSPEPSSRPSPAEPSPPSSHSEPAAASPRPALPLPADEWTAVEERILELTNVERLKAGLKPLQREDGLRASARAQSADMIARHFFDHVNPSGENPSDRIGRIHRTLIGTAGENIWKGTGASFASDPDLAGFIVRAWMGSPHHRENILRAEFTHLGVGVVFENDEVRATQNFSGVRAYLRTALPQTAATGAPVTLATEGAKPEARMFDLQPVGKAAAETHPSPIADARLAAAPGVYRVRFYFPEDNGRFAIYDGPQVTVR